MMSMQTVGTDLKPTDVVTKQEKIEKAKEIAAKITDIVSKVLVILGIVTLATAGLVFSAAFLKAAFTPCAYKSMSDFFKIFAIAIAVGIIGGSLFGFAGASEATHNAIKRKNESGFGILLPELNRVNPPVLSANVEMQEQD